MLGVFRAGVALGLVAVSALVLGGPVAAAQAPGDAPPALLLVLDASGSMNGDDGSGRPKLVAAKEALNAVVADLPDGAPVGLRVYGHRVPNTDKANGCRDTELIAPVAPLDRARLTAAIAGFSAKGFTPIGASLQAAAGDLPATGARTVVLVSDGIDTCAPPDPCQVARDLAAQGVGLRIETVGFQVDAAAADQLRCIAAATGGTYLDAPDAGALTRGLTAVSARAFRNYVPTGRRVLGAPGRESAPLVAVMTEYQDTLADGQTKWYVFDVGPDQRVIVRAAIIGPAASVSALEIGRLRLSLVDPAGDEDATGLQVNVGAGVSQAEVIGGTRGPLGLTSDRLPGRWAVRVSVEDLPEELVGRDLPLELFVEIRGPSSPATTVAPSTPVAEKAAAAPRGNGGGRDAGGWLTPSVIAAYLGLAVLGAACGAAAVARRR